jgi:hypothetical protein
VPSCRSSPLRTSQAPQGQHQQLHALLSDVANAVTVPHASDAILLAPCSVQFLSEVCIINSDLAALMLPALARCKALARMELCLGPGFDAVAKQALELAASHEPLQHATIRLRGSHPFFDLGNQDDQATLLELATSTKDLQIHLQTTADADADYIDSNLLPLCSVPGVKAMCVDAGPQHAELPLSNSWWHFSLLQRTCLRGILLDDSCVGALNCLTALEELEVSLIQQPLHQGNRATLPASVLRMP